MRDDFHRLQDAKVLRGICPDCGHQDWTIAPGGSKNATKMVTCEHCGASFLIEQKVKPTNVA